MIHIVKGFSAVNETEIDVFLEFSCFFYDPMDVGNSISGSSAFSQYSLYIWKFLVDILLKPAAAAAAAAKLLQSCLTLCDPIHGSPPGSAVPGILQARILEWVAISFSNAWKWKVKMKSLSCTWLLATPWTAAYQAPTSMGFSRWGYWSGLPLPSPLLKPSLKDFKHYLASIWNEFSCVCVCLNCIYMCIYQLYVCVYVYIYIYIHTYQLYHIHIYINCMYIFMCVCIYVFIYLPIYVYMFACIHIYNLFSFSEESW